MDNEHTTTLPPLPRRPAGEIRIWLTGLGLATGLVMIAAFLAVIVINGLNAFWPGPVEGFSLKQNENQILYASIVKEEEDKGEYQVFTGNKEAYGQAFRYIAKDDIITRSEPEELIEIERLSGGKILGRPLFMIDEQGSRIDVGTPSFDEKLSLLVSDAERNREQVEDVEKGDIAPINRELDEVKRRLKALEMSYRFVPDEGGMKALPLDERIIDVDAPLEEKTRLEADIKTLDEQYRFHMDRLAALRANVGKSTLYYEIGDGVERSIETANIVDFIRPNQLGFMGKMSVFLSRMWNFISEDPREANTEGGVFPAIFGTFVMTVLMCLLVTPIGVIAAIYLKEYARQGTLVRIVRICVNNLAGVPSIVFGVFGLGFFVYFVGGAVDNLFYAEKLAVSQAPTFGTSGILWASLTLALMTLPVVIVSTEEALNSVPRGLREAALACGASKWQMIQRVILPGALPGILTGVILAMARGAGEVAPLMVTGVVKLAPDLPIDMEAPFFHLERKFMHLGFHIYDVAFQSPDSDAARSMVFATTLLLIVLVVVMNLAAIMIRNRLRKRHQLSSF